MAYIAFIAPFALFFLLLFLGRASGRKKRRNELVGFVEPLGFDVLSKFDDKLIADFYHHLPTLSFKINITAICVADSDSMRIIVMEYLRHSQLASPLPGGIRHVESIFLGACESTAAGTDRGRPCPGPG
jgi:hypothetical protein